MSKPLFFCSVFLISLKLLNSEVYINRPKIKAKDGDLIFEPAYNKNIYLRLNGPKSSIFFGENDIKSLSNVSNGNVLYTPSPTSVIQNKAIVADDVLKRIERLESLTAELTSNLNVTKYRLTQRINNINRKVLIKNKKTDNCHSNPCANGGTCLNLVNDYHCLCPLNWKGENCDEDVNECSNYAGSDLGCQNGATCINKPGSYECVCKPGWYGIHCTKTTQNCSQGDFEMCGHGICIPVESGIKCICNQGWTTDGKSVSCLTDIDECQSVHGPRCSVNPKVVCINLPGSFRCGACPQGYEGDGFACYDIDECLTLQNGGCSTSPMVSCHNTIGSRICGSCPPGYQGDGTTCTWRGSCALNHGGCHPSANCVEGTLHLGMTQCICPLGMTGDGIGLNGCYMPYFDNTTQSCESNPCGIHGHCHPLRQGYTCICYQGYGGAHCNEQNNYCKTNPCHNGGTCRIDERVSRGYRCECTALYSGELCQIYSKPCGGVLDYEEGSIIYPISNTTYSHNTRCAWVIHTAQDKVINVTFSKFNLENHKNCLYDFVQIHDGKSSASQLIGRFCGNVFPNGGNIISSHNNLYFWFRSDHSVAKEGFSLHWNSIPPICGGEINATIHGNIRSPGSPGPYPPNRDCYWHLSTTLGKRIQLHFFELEIEQHENCSFDYLAIYDGTHKTDPLINKYCSSTQPAPIQSAGSDVLIYFHSNADTQGKGFQISYAPIEGVPGCGGFFTTDRGEIVSPSYNGAYLHNLLCEYKIKTIPRTKIRIEIKSFKLEKSLRCKYDYLKIYDGASTDAPLVGRFCGNIDKIFKFYTSSSNSLFIVFKSDHSTASEGFKISYESLCLNEITGDSGIIKTPGYPMNYPKNMICDYIISTKPGKAIILTFQDFDIEDSKYYNCHYDYVEVRDGHTINSTLLGRYCGNSESTPPIQTSSNNYMHIRFKSDISLVGRGFYANYTTIDAECGGIYRENYGIINHPSDNNTRYSNSRTCTWLLDAPDGMFITLTWNRFEIKSVPLCVNNYVLLSEIEDNNLNYTLGKYCGSSTPPAITTSSNRLMIKFVADSSIHSGGFSLSYSFRNKKTHCGGYYVNTHGFIYSPGWPESYEPNRDCSWVITVPAGQQIVLNITDFDLERPLRDNCKLGDYLTIRDGSTNNSSLIGIFCGNFKSKIVTSTAHSIYLQFHSDFYLGGKGFKIEWDGTIRGCGGTLNGLYGSISSPNYPLNYNENAECFYRIVTSSGSKISITFKELDLEKTKDCRGDYVEIFDGRDTNSLSLGRYCSKTTTLESIITSSNYAFIKFRSDIFINARGFLFDYNTVCNKHISGSYGVIESPGYPGQYPLNINCIWIITVPKGNKINATFTFFELSPPVPRRVGRYISGFGIRYNVMSSPFYSYPIAYECDSYVQVGEPSQPAIKKCGSYLPAPISTKSNSLEIKFVSGGYFPRNGFRIEWISYGCGGHIKKRIGTLSLHRNFNSSGEIECEWTIETPIGTAVSITFLNINLFSSKNCSVDAIEIYNGQNAAFPLLTRTCHPEKVSVQASSNYLFVRLFKTSSLKEIDFNSYFDSFKTGCGGKINALSGIIQSKNYPRNYENNLDCTWVLSVPKNHRIELTFLSFDLYSVYGNDDDCNDSIKIYDNSDNSIDSHYTTIICPNSNVTKLVSIHSSIKIQFQTNEHGTAKGFKANFTMTCGAVINTTSNGIISNSKFINDARDSCVWIIYSPNLSDKIKLTIQHISIPNLRDGSSTLTCPSSYLKVLDGNDLAAPIIDEFCGRKVPPTIISQGSALTIMLGTHTGNLTGLFTAHYSTVTNACGGTLTSEEGSIASPNYPLSYPTNVDCEWILKTSPGNRVYITFESFDLNFSENCNEDYLEIRDNNSGGELLATYCGSEIPVNTTTGTQLFIKFYSDSKETSRGFLLHYGFLHGNEITGLQNGEISSPLYPFPYDGQGEYSWRIFTDESTTVNLIVDRLEIMKNTDVCDSKLLIFDGFDDEAPLLQELCGLINTENRNYFSTANVVLIKLVLTPENTGSLFHIRWHQSNKIIEEGNDKNTNCGLNKTQQVSPSKAFVFYSPNYPNAYPADSNCVWIFETILGHHLSLSFEEIALEQTPNCFADYISVFSLTPKGWNPIKENFCFANEKIKMSTTSSMKVKFKSDQSISRKGFQASVSSICGGTLQESSGFVEVTWFDYKGQIPYQNLRCNWTVIVRPGKTIQLKFIHFNITNDNECNTYVVLRNGESNESPLLGNGKFCGYSHENRDQIITSSNALFISFVSNTLRTIHYLEKSFMNFKLHYEEKSIECGVKSNLDTSHKWEIIKSPRYPDIPMPYTECVWTFTGPPGEILRVDFIERFDLENSEQCAFEYVEIRDGSSELAPLIELACKEKPGTMKTSANSIFIKYSTQIAEPRNGFKANVSIDTCGGTIYGKAGEITSPGYPHMIPLPTGVVCQWHIISLSSHTIQINFKDFDLPSSEVPCGSKITIEETIFTNNTSASGKIKELCVGEIADYKQPIITFTNKAIVKLYIGKLSHWTHTSENRGFRLDFNSSIPSCGEWLTTSEGFLTTPGYPRETSFRYCRWTIIVPDVSRRIRLELLDYDTDNDISVFDNLDVFSSVEKSFNRNNLSSLVFESTGNKMSLYIFVTKRNKARFRFKAKFSSNEPALCGGYLQGNKGELKSPNLVGSHLCDWNYNEVSPGNDTKYNTISVQITTFSSGTENKICRYSDSQLQIKSNVLNNGLPFMRKVCGNKTRVLFRIPATNLNIKALQRKITPITFDLSWNLHECGGIIHAGQDLVNIMNVLTNHSMVVDCAWLIIAPVGLRIELTLEGSFNLDCSDEFVIINQDFQQYAPNIAKYCQNELPEKSLLTSFKHTYVQYHSKPQNNTKVKLMVKTVSELCGGYLTQVDRIFTSPNYPKNYNEQEECIWEIHAEIGYRISLQFTDRFAVEHTENCTKDVLIILDWKDNKYKEMARVCGRRTPLPLNSTSNYMKVIFRTDATNNLNGFKARWEPVCGGTLEAKENEQYLYSPGYPSRYYSLLNCKYDIISTNSEKISIKFLDFELEGSFPDCEYDNVTLESTGGYEYFYHVYCGTELPPVTYFSNSIQIIFKTDRYSQKKGFKLSFAKYSCGGSVKEPTVLSLLPNTNYIENTNCTWLIESPANKIIILKFIFIDLENSIDCYDDYIAVYDGPIIDTNKRMSLMCGHINTTTVIKSKTSKVTLQFVSDGSLSYSGFKAEVFFTYSESVGCGGHIELTSSATKNIKTPLIGNNFVYENYLDCHWTIKAPQDNVIKIHFTSFHIAPCSNVNQTALGFNKCDCDFVEIKDGLNPNSLIISRYCGHNLPPYQMSSSNYMTIRFSSDGEGSSSGFEATLTSHPSECGSSHFVVSNTSQVLQSPGYLTGFIPRGLHCTYYFDTSSDTFSTIHIRIHNLDLETGTDNTICNKDRLVISSYSQSNMNATLNKDLIINESNDDFFSRGLYFYDLTTKYPKRFELCGQNKIVDYYVSGNVKVIISTTPEVNTPHKGVELSVAYVSFCGRNYSDSYGRIQSQINNYNNLGSEDCYTLISAPENYTISLYFLSLSPVYWNAGAYLEIFDGNTTTSSSLLKVLKEYQNIVQVFSTNRYLLLHNRVKDSEAVTYDLNYITSDKGIGCGGKLHNAFGRVTSPLYPKTYRSKNTCEWELETPIGSRIMLHFLVFDLGRICDQNYVSLVDRNGNAISSYCSENPADFTSVDNYVKIVFTTTKNNAGTGWVAEFIAVL